MAGPPATCVQLSKCLVPRAHGILKSDYYTRVYDSLNITIVTGSQR